MPNFRSAPILSRNHFLGDAFEENFSHLLVYWARWPIDGELLRNPIRLTSTDRHRRDPANKKRLFDKKRLFI